MTFPQKFSALFPPLFLLLFAGAEPDRLFGPLAEFVATSFGPGSIQEPLV